MRRTRLPVLEPCAEDFDAMPGSATRRFCERCSAHVHDLSNLTERQAEALLQRHRGTTVCVRYRYDARGKVEFRREAPAVAFVAAMSIVMAACTGYVDPEGLEGPDDAAVCRDASGYAIDCDLVDEATIPRVDPALEEGTEGAVEGGVVGGEVGAVLGAVVGGTLPASDPPTACPLPRPGARDEPERAEAPELEDGRVMTRRERRRARRAARRARRRARRGMVVGRLGPL